MDIGDSGTIASRSLIKRRRKKQRQRNNFYSTNYSEFLTPDNYTVDAQENICKKSSGSNLDLIDSGSEQRSYSSDRKSVERQSTVSSSGFESAPPSQEQILDLVDDLKNINLDSGESTSTDDVNDDLDYLNLVFQDPAQSDLDSDRLAEDQNQNGVDYNSEEFTALSCEKVKML